jgi:hypothetical protein
MPQTFPSDFNLASLNGINGFAINGEPLDAVGNSLTFADINADGYPDVFIGAEYASPGQRQKAGSVFVVFGQAAPLPALFELKNLNGHNGFRINGVASGDETGTFMASVGDINGDKIDDMAIGSCFASPNNLTTAGSIFIVKGQAQAFPAVLELSSLNGANGYRINGPFKDSEIGSAIAGAGDFNGDGIDDILIGFPAGQAAFVIYGHRSNFPAILELSTINGNNGFRINFSGPPYNSIFGRAVAGLGDFNGDNRADIAIAASGISPSPDRNAAGAVFVIYGQSTPFPAVFSFNSLDGKNGFCINGVAALDELGYPLSVLKNLSPSCSNALIIAAITASPNLLREAGSVFVVCGSPNTYAAILELNTLNGNNGFRINGIQEYDHIGWSVSSLANINGRGRNSLFIGSPTASDPNGNSTGQAYVIFGQETPFAATIELSQLSGSNGFHLKGAALKGSLGNAVAGSHISPTGLGYMAACAPTAASSSGNYAGSCYIVYGDSITWLNNQLEIMPGEVAQLNVAALDVAVPPPLLSVDYAISQLKAGHFERNNQSGVAITNFSSLEVNNHSITFVHDGSDNAPAYTVTASHILARSNSTAAVRFIHPAPQLLNNTLQILQGETRLLSTDELSAQAVKNAGTPDLRFDISEPQYIRFSSRATGDTVLTFTQQNVTQGDIWVIHDGSPHAPVYQVNVSDAYASFGPYPPRIDFIGRPSIICNRYEIYSPSSLLINSSNLAAYDPSSITASLLFKIENISRGNFVQGDTDSVLTQFTDLELNNKQIYFQPDNSSLKPSFTVTVSNGVFSSEPSVAEVHYVAPTPAAPAETADNNVLRNGLIAGGVLGGCALVGLALWAFKRHTQRSKPQDQNLQERLNSSSVEIKQSSYKTLSL